MNPIVRHKGLSDKLNIEHTQKSDNNFAMPHKNISNKKNYTTAH